VLTATQRIRVEWAHCDPAGIIFNPHYYIWMDSGTHALLQVAGFDLIGQTRSDELFRGCPLVASNMAFSKPLYFGDIAVGDDPIPVANGNEVRVWGYADADDPAKLVARAMPAEVRAMLSVEKTVDVTV